MFDFIFEVPTWIKLAALIVFVVTAATFFLTRKSRKRYSELKKRNMEYIKEILKRLDEIEEQLDSLEAATGLEDGTRIIELVDQLLTDIQSIVGDITNVEAKWDDLKKVFGL